MLNDAIKHPLKLGQHQVDLWQAYPDQFREQDTIDHLEQCLTTTEKDKIQQCLRSKERHIKLVSRAFVRHALSKYIDEAADKINFAYSRHGKPKLADHKNLSFNLSHCNDCIVLAVSSGAEVGVDIERIRYKPSLMQIDDFFFDAKELEDLGQLNGNSKQRRFFDYWTLKESYIKATGQGLTAPLNKIGFAIDQDRIQVEPIKDNINQDWKSWLWPISNQHRLALTIDDSQENPIGIRHFYFHPN
jgi:4'-phosphopantetheinyl transferase